jgi:hypothetical protein
MYVMFDVMHTGCSGELLPLSGSDAVLLDVLTNSTAPLPQDLLPLNTVVGMRSPLPFMCRKVFIPRCCTAFQACMVQMIRSQLELLEFGPASTATRQLRQISYLNKTPLLLLLLLLLLAAHHCGVGFSRPLGAAAAGRADLQGIRCRLCCAAW